MCAPRSGQKGLTKLGARAFGYHWTLVLQGGGQSLPAHQGLRADAARLGEFDDGQVFDKEFALVEAVMDLVGANHE